MRPIALTWVRDAPRFGAALQVPNDNSLGARREYFERCDAIGRTRVQHHSMSLMEEGMCRGPAKTVRASCDECDRHAVLLRMPRTHSTKPEH